MGLNAFWRRLRGKPSLADELAKPVVYRRKDGITVLRGASLVTWDEDVVAEVDPATGGVRFRARKDGDHGDQ